MILVEVPGVEIRTDLRLEESPDEQVVQKTVVLVGNRRGQRTPIVLGIKPRHRLAPFAVTIGQIVPQRIYSAFSNVMVLLLIIIAVEKSGPADNE